MEHAKDRALFLAQLAREIPAKVASADYLQSFADKMYRYACKYNRNACWQCNDGNYEDKGGYKQRELLKGKLIELTAEFAPYITGVIFQNDPRGCTVKLTVKSGKTDDMAQEGLCVPGS